MKKITLLFILALCFLLNCECDAQSINSSSKWMIAKQLDEFGDHTKRYDLCYETTGTFSNNKITNEKLIARIYFTSNFGVFIQFIEYGKFNASLYTGLNAPLLVKSQKDKTASFLMVPRSKGRIFPYIKTTEYNNFSDFITLLKDETYLKCLFVDKNNQSYSFQIDCRGFSKAYNTFLSSNNINDIRVLEPEFLYAID